jgi:Coenzyme PQQ synthesis protein D (PqqD)
MIRHDFEPGTGNLEPGTWNSSTRLIERSLGRAVNLKTLTPLAFQCLLTAGSTRGRMSEPNVHDREITRGREVVTRQIADETLIVPIAGGVGDLDAIYTLNGVAARIWQLLEEPTTAERIVQAIQEEFNVDPDRAAADVTEFLAALGRARLIVGVRS